MANLLSLIDELFNVFLSNTCNGLYFWHSFIYLTLFNVTYYNCYIKKVLLEDIICEYWKQIDKCHLIYVDFRNYVHDNHNSVCVGIRTVKQQF